MIPSVKSSILFLFLIMFLAGAEIADIIYRSDIKYSIKTASLERKLINREKEGAECLEKLHNNRADLSELSIIMERNASSDKHILLYYRNDSLILWTDNSFDAPALLPEYLTRATLVNMDGRKMVVTNSIDSVDTFICLVPIWRDFQIENNILRSGFISSLIMPEGAFIDNNPDVGYPVFNVKGDFLFSVNYDEADSFLTWFFLISMSLWVLFVFVMVLLINRFSLLLTEREYGYLAPLVSLVIPFLLYFLIILTGHPWLITNLDLFSPYHFTMGRFIPSPGHLLLFILIIYYFTWSFYRWFPLKTYINRSYAGSLAILIVRLLPGPFILLIYTRLQSLLISESNISFDLHRVLEIDNFTIAAFSSAALLMLILITYLIKILRTVQTPVLKFIMPAAIVTSLVVLILFSSRGELSWAPVLIWVIIFFSAWLFRNLSGSILNAAVVFAIGSALYASLIIPEVNRQREMENLAVMAVNYSTDNDLYAEFLLQEIWFDLKSDATLASLMSKPLFTDEDADNIYDYLDRVYFNGYWGNFTRIYTMCNHDSELILEGVEGLTPDCFDFFSGRMTESGAAIIDSSMVFIENNSGRAYYMGAAYFDNGENGHNGLFIELISRIEYIQSGYPELLVDNRYAIKPALQDYQMAKYVNDTLVMQTGTGFFDVLAPKAEKGIREFVVQGRNDIELVVFRKSNNVTIVIARPTLTFLDRVVIFTYLFIGFFLLIMPGLMLMKHNDIWESRILFRHKMQYAFVIVLLCAMSAVGGMVIYLSTDQYRVKHLENIREKLNSVYII